MKNIRINQLPGYIKTLSTRKTKLIYMGLFLLLLQWQTGNASVTELTGLNTTMQQLTITGTIIDATGAPLPGVNVVVKGTTSGVVTDVDGKYSLKVDQPDAVLVFSSIGYITSEQAVGDRRMINVTLSEQTLELDEVIVVGYGTMKKRDMVGSTAKITGASLNKLPVTSISQSMQGMASGLYIGDKSGHPGRGPEVLIRGKNSINLGTGPLWVIDGVAIMENTNELVTSGVKEVSAISMINPNDIESIEVLKDAAATSIYGNRAAGGVIMITTKSNKGKLTGVNINYDGGLSWLPFKQNDIFVDSGTWWDMVDKAWANVGNTIELQPNTITNVVFLDSHKPDTKKEDARRTNTDHLGAMSQTAMFHQVGVTANKGFETGGVMFSLNYRNEEGVLIHNNVERVTGRFNFNFSPLKKLNIGVSSNMQYFKNQGVISGDQKGAFYGGWGSFYSTLPWYKIYDPTHQTGYWHPNSGYNVVASADPNLARNDADMYRTISNAFLKWDTPLEGLSVRGEIGIDLMITNSSWWRSSFMSNEPYKSSASEQSITKHKWTYNAYMNYNRTFGKHNVDVTAGAEAITGGSYTRRAEGSEIYSAYPELIDPINRTMASGKKGVDAQLLGYFGRINYKFNDRYLINFSIRKDGHGALAKDNRWATFTSIGAGWILTEEEFINIPAINLLKLRGSYGQVGNSNINRSMTRMEWGLSNNRYGTDYLPGTTTLGPMGNAALKWESTATTDIGIDFGLLENRISGSVAYYTQKMTDLILKGKVQPSTGFGTNELWENVGDMKNWGWEFNVSSVNINRHFRWSTDFNFSYNRNKITGLNQFEKGKGSEGTYEIRKEGEMLNTWYLANCTGVDPQKGILMIEQRDVDKWDKEYVTTSTGTLIPGTSNNVTANRMVQSGKSPLPTFYGGMTNTFTYKGFDLNILLTFAGGHYLKNHLYDKAALIIDGTPLTKDMVGDYWEKPGDVKKFPMLSYNANFKYDNAGNPVDKPVEYKSTASTFFLSKADYLKLRNVQLGYTFPNSLTGKIKLQNVRVYVGASNLYTLTKFDGIDPETNGDLPIPRTFNFGLSLNL